MNTTNNFENNDYFDYSKLHGSDKGKELYKKYLEENSNTPKSIFVTSNTQPENQNKNHIIENILNNLPANLPTTPICTASTKNNDLHSSNSTYKIDSHNKRELYTTAFVVGTIKALRFNYAILKSVYESLPDFGEIISNSIQNGLSEKTIEDAKDALDTIGKKIQYSFIKNYESQIKFIIKIGTHLLKIEKAFDSEYDNQLPHLNPKTNIFQKNEENNQRYNQ